METYRPALVLRADADATIGSGHVMRCLALAQAWQRTGGIAVFACRDLPAPIRERLLSAGCQVQPISGVRGSASDALALAQIAQDFDAAWIAMDGYAFEIDYQRELTARTERVMLVRDDDRPTHIAATALLNPNVFARRECYPADCDAVFMLGTSFALLREEFRAGNSARRNDASTARRLLVTFGGADPHDMMSRALGVLRDVVDGEWHVDAVAGSRSQRAPNTAASRSATHVEWHENVRDMAALMSRADAALTGGGSTCYELARMGVPMLVVALSENQCPAAERLAELGAASYVGAQGSMSDCRFTDSLRHFLRDANYRKTLADNARQLVDGRGSSRVVERLWQPLMALRPARIDDAALLFAWQRDLEVRRWSFSSGPANFSEHREWLEGRLSDSRCEMLICETTSGAAMGLVRFERRLGCATTGLLLDPAFRGRRLAALVLRTAIERYSRRHPNATLEALIKSENESSRRVFAAAGFRLAGSLPIRGEAAERWTMVGPWHNSFNTHWSQVKNDGSCYLTGQE